MKSTIQLKKDFNLKQTNLVPIFKAYIKKHFPEKEKELGFAFEPDGWCYGIGYVISFLLTSENSLQLIEKFLNDLQNFYEINKDEKSELPKNSDLEPIILDMAERQNVVRHKEHSMFASNIIFKLEAIGQLCQTLLSEPGSSLCFGTTYFKGDGHGVFVCKAKDPSLFPDYYYLIDANNPGIIQITNDLSQINDFIKESLTTYSGTSLISWIIPDKTKTEITQTSYSQLIDQISLLKNLERNFKPARYSDDSEVKKFKYSQNNTRCEFNTKNLSKATSDYPWLLKKIFKNNLSNRDLKDHSFKGCKLENVNFERSNLSGVDFTGATFNAETNFNGATFNAETNFNGATFLFRKKSDYTFLNSLKDATLSNNPLHNAILKAICGYLYERRGFDGAFSHLEWKDIGIQRAETLFYALIRGDKNAEKMLNHFLSSGEITGATSFLGFTPSIKLKSVLMESKKKAISEAKIKPPSSPKPRFFKPSRPLILEFNDSSSPTWTWEHFKHFDQTKALAFANQWTNLDKVKSYVAPENCHEIDYNKVLSRVCHRLAISQREGQPTAELYYSHAGQYLFDKIINDDKARRNILLEFMETGKIKLQTHGVTHVLIDEALRQELLNLNLFSNVNPSLKITTPHKDVMAGPVEFSKKNLCGVSFKNANLSGAFFDQCLFDEKTDFTEADLTNFYFFFTKATSKDTLCAAWRQFKKATLSRIPLYNDLLKEICQYLSDQHISDDSRSKAEDLFMFLNHGQKDSINELEKALNTGLVEEILTKSSHKDLLIKRAKEMINTYRVAETTASSSITTRL